MSKLKCINCANFDECPAGEGDSPEDLECEFFEAKEEVQETEQILEVEELGDEEGEFVEEEFTEPEPKPKPKPKKTKPKKAKKKDAPKKPKEEKKEFQSESKLPSEPEPKQEAKMDVIEYAVVKRQKAMVAKIKFLMDLMKTRPDMQQYIKDSQGVIDRLADLITTEEASKIAALLL